MTTFPSKGESIIVADHGGEEGCEMLRQLDNSSNVVSFMC
jgi:hypothetical protein